MYWFESAAGDIEVDTTDRVARPAPEKYNFGGTLYFMLLSFLVL